MPVEHDLLRRARVFERQALTEIYDQYSHKLYNYAVRQLGDADLAEECVAETFARFLRAIKSGGGPEKYLQAYLYRVAHNWITDLYRRQPPLPLSLGRVSNERKSSGNRGVGGGGGGALRPRTPLFPGLLPLE